MQQQLLSLLRCPVSKSLLQLKTISRTTRQFKNGAVEVTWEGILFSEGNEWFYPVVNGIPRLLVESFLDYSEFLQKHLPDYKEKCDHLLNKHERLVHYVVNKNKRSKKSFALEWGLFNYEEDKTWDAGHETMMQRFQAETDESKVSVVGKLVFDAGCGNGLLNQFMAEAGMTVVGMDLSESIVRAYEHNQHERAMFIQGDVQFPPLAFESFDIVHCSGVLIHTNNTEFSFSCIDPCVKAGGKLSVWLYHPRKNLSHNVFNFIRKFTSKLPIRMQYYLYLFTLFPASFVLKKLKGNKQNAREMMIDIIDWFSPQYRWEHRPEEAESWFRKRNYSNVKITTKGTFGFNIIGIKNK